MSQAPEPTDDEGAAPGDWLQVPLECPLTGVVTAVHVLPWFESSDHLLDRQGACECGPTDSEWRDVRSPPVWNHKPFNTLN